MRNNCQYLLFKNVDVCSKVFQYLVCSNYSYITHQYRHTCWTLCVEVTSTKSVIVTSITPFAKLLSSSLVVHDSCAKPHAYLMTSSQVAPIPISMSNCAIVSFTVMRNTLPALCMSIRETSL